MIFLWFILIVFLCVFGMLMIRKYSSVEFVSHAKLLFRAWSVWLASAGSVLGAWAQSFPQSALDAWNVLPADIKSFLPPGYLSFIASFMVALAVIAQFVRQKKLARKVQ